MDQGANPWITTGRRQSAPERAPATAGQPTLLSGPEAPQGGVTVPSWARTLPVREHHEPAGLWMVGAHGGSGESTLARLHSSWRAGEHAWPVMADGSSAPVVLVARTYASGLRDAQGVLAQWASGAVPGVRLIGLVLVAEAPGRLARPLRAQVEVLSGGAPRSWYVPWVDPWRYGEEPTVETGGTAIGRLVEELNSTSTGAHGAGL